MEAAASGDWSGTELHNSCWQRLLGLARSWSKTWPNSVALAESRVEGGVVAEPRANRISICSLQWVSVWIIWSCRLKKKNRMGYKKPLTPRFRSQINVQIHQLALNSAAVASQTSSKMKSSRVTKQEEPTAELICTPSALVRTFMFVSFI